MKALLLLLQIGIVSQSCVLPISEEAGGGYLNGFRSSTPTNERQPMAH